MIDRSPVSHSKPALLWLCILLAPAPFAAGCAGGGAEPVPHVVESSFASPTDCAGCHPRQYAEWQGSMMHYATISPVFNALELVGNALTGGDFARGGRDDLFCQNCHTPVSVAVDEFPTWDEMQGRPSRDFAGAVGRHGVSCDVCHQVAHADLDGSLLGDGIANAAFVLDPGFTKFGPLFDPQPIASPRHTMQANAYLSDAAFCGSCHDVRPRGEDVVTGEPFFRLENLFTEWQGSPYASADNPFGRVISCQDCHMSLYPYAPPGTYPRNQVTTYGNPPVRDVSTHYFTGVDVALIDFPGQDTPGLDGYGMPVAQRTRRADLLKAACDVNLGVPESARSGEVLPVAVDVTNVGAGHNVPAGFSQERQVWIEIVVADGIGTVIYESGYLVDSAHPETGELEPDGRLDDEDLLDLLGNVRAETSSAELTLGPDHNQRPDTNLGVVNFGNTFERIDDDGEHHEVFVPFIANHMNNGHSIAPFETVRAIYDVPVPSTAVAPISVDVRLRFRPFPPRFLRMLAQERPDLVDEVMVDRNEIVDMAEAAAQIPLVE